MKKPRTIKALRADAMRKRRESEVIEIVIVRSGLQFRVPWYDMDSWKRVLEKQGIEYCMRDLREPISPDDQPMVGPIPT